MKNIKKYIVKKSFAEFTEGQIVTNDTLRVRRKVQEDPVTFQEITDEEIDSMKKDQKAQVDKERAEAKKAKNTTGSPQNKALDVPDNKSEVSK